MRWSYSIIVCLTFFEACAFDYEQTRRNTVKNLQINFESLQITKFFTVEQTQLICASEVPCLLIWHLHTGYCWVWDKVYFYWTQIKIEPFLNRSYRIFVHSIASHCSLSALHIQESKDTSDAVFHWTNLVNIYTNVFSLSYQISSLMLEIPILTVQKDRRGRGLTHNHTLRPSRYGSLSLSLLTPSLLSILTVCELVVSVARYAFTACDTWVLPKFESVRVIFVVLFV